MAEDGTGGRGVGRTDCPESEGNKDHRKQGERHCSGTRKLGRAGSFSTESDGNFNVSFRGQILEMAKTGPRRLFLSSKFSFTGNGQLD